MASFTTRVELHNATTWQEYEALHTKMQSQGFQQTIKSDAGTVYELPPAEYNYVGDVARNAVLAKATSAAVSAGFPIWTPKARSDAKTSAVFVTEATARTWDGLKPKA